MGDLPIGALRPLAVTGELSYVIPDRPVNTANDNGGTPRSLKGGLSVQYSMPYLQSQVKDHGFGEFINRLVPLVELSYVTPTAAPSGGAPMTLAYGAGAIYLGDKFQVGTELLIPGNKAAGSNIGFIVQLHFFLDDILPNSRWGARWRRRRGSWSCIILRGWSRALPPCRFSMPRAPGWTATICRPRRGMRRRW